MVAAAMAQADHIPVLLDQVLESLAPQAGQTCADATAGLGGHSLEIGRRLGSSGTLVLNDVDPGNLERAERLIRHELGEGCPGLVCVRGNFADLPRRLVELGIVADVVLADLGFSSNQMADASRGFSFMHDAPLDMRLDPTLPTTAAALLAGADVGELARILSEYGEERQAGRIARKLAEARARQPITTTAQLAQLVRGVLARPGASSGKGGEGIDPATRTFQALRIAVNDELGVLESLLDSIRHGAERAAGRAGRTGDGQGWLRAGARVGIISFHSLEDRLVKRAFASMASDELAASIGQRLQRAEESELQANRRSRSARLRAVRIAGGGR